MKFTSILTATPIVLCTFLLPTHLPAQTAAPTAEQEDAPSTKEIEFDQAMLLLEQQGSQGSAEALGEMTSKIDDFITKFPDSHIGQGWRASVLVLKSSKLFQKGDWQNGLEKWNEGLEILFKLDTPDASPAVKLRLASIFLNSWKYEPSPERKANIRSRGISSYESLVETTYAKQLPNALRDFLRDRYETASKAGQNEPEKDASANQNAPSARFDFEVREDFFEGIFNDDMQAFRRAMKKCESALEENPENWEAMVWLGSGKVYESGQLQETGNSEKAAERMDQGLAMMHEACARAPDDVSVLIPRAATLIQIGRTVPLSNSQRLALLNLAVYDYEKTFELQEAYFDSLSSHAKGELLFGLGDGWHQLNNKKKSSKYFKEVVRLSPESEQADLAEMFLTGRIDKNVLANRSCVGCH